MSTIQIAAGIDNFFDKNYSEFISRSGSLEFMSNGGLILLPLKICS
ncbi:hypothetical protein [Pelosinus fermentans]|nr:hypothetical protein [Pelosinus fermentans]